MIEQRIGFIGGGQMAQALARGFLAGDLITGDRLGVSDPSDVATEQFQKSAPGAAAFADNQQVAAECDIVFLAVKPQYLSGALQSIGEVRPECLLVSIVAGATIDSLSAESGTSRIIRVMPNTPCLIGQGAAGYARGLGASPEDASVVQQLLEAVGVCFELPENLLDAVTGLSGSGPAFVYAMIEAMSDGGVRMGLPRNVATALAAQTVRGAAGMVLETEEHPAVLKDRVASPGGTTIAGLQTLEDYRIRAGLIAAVQSATQRAAELG